jgi:UDP-N-acetylglucosamine/UDP-N-acetyl-alpha-D-glucosaminouronate 4-epimerase
LDCQLVRQVWWNRFLYLCPPCNNKKSHFLKILVTGGAGFIGSNICKSLLEVDGIELVRVIDNLSTGFHSNIEPFLANTKFEFVNGDIREFATCNSVMKNIDLVIHQAALGSVPRSIQDPIATNDHNINGTLNIFFAAKENKVRKIIFASSSSPYGNNRELPKREENLGEALSPYAVTKLVSELYANVFSKIYDFHFIGFRYFNVFGPNQSPSGSYAAVIPLFFKEMLAGRSPVINGNGKQSRDFTYVDNVVDIHLKAIFNENPAAWNQIYNVAFSCSTSLNELYRLIAQIVGFSGEPVYGPERKGDIKDSLADISKAHKLLHYNPIVSVENGLNRTYHWYKEILMGNRPSLIQ